MALGFRRNEFMDLTETEITMLFQDGSARIPRRVSLKAMLLVPVMLLALAACDMMDRLLEVEHPGRIDAGVFDDPENARMMVAGVVADFECAFAHYINSAGLLGMELHDSQLTAAQWDFDRRTLERAGGWYATSTCAGRIGTYTPLATARWAADDAIRKLQEWTDAEVAGDRRRLLATAAAYSGYAHVLMGEGFCSMAFDMGPEVMPAQVFERAMERFDLAIQEGQAVGDSDIVHMSGLGRARALLNLGRTAEAAQYAAQIFVDYEKFALYSPLSGRSENQVVAMNVRNRQTSIFDAYRDLTIEGVPDPRVPVFNTGAIAPDQETIQWQQRKYTSNADPIRLASWTEAQLIIAEHEGGQTAVNIINDLHARVGLPPIQASEPDEILDWIVTTRAREFFLESHHLGDVRRYDLPLIPAPGAPYPIKGGYYGDQRCFPLPDAETRNNPNIP